MLLWDACCMSLHRVGPHMQDTKIAFGRAIVIDTERDRQGTV